MPESRIDFDTVRTIGLTLAGVEEGTAYGSPALRIRGKLLTCLPVNKSAEPDSLAVRIDFEQRAALLEADPDAYYVTDHYKDHPMVLVRLSRLHPDALRGLLEMAWTFVNPKTQRAKRRGVPRRRT